MNALFRASSRVTFQLSMVAGLAVLAWCNRRGWISIGDIVLYQSLFSMIVMCVSQLLNIYPQLARGFESSSLRQHDRKKARNELEEYRLAGGRSMKCLWSPEFRGVCR